MHPSFIISIIILGGAAGYALPSGHLSPSKHMDWSVAIVESTIERFTPETIGDWEYTTGLYLLGQYEVYKRTRDARYLTYIEQWADRFVDDNGYTNNTFDSLDSMQAGNIFLLLHEERGDTKYETAARQIRDRLETYPRTDEGGFWHATTWAHQLWADGTFMVNPFLIRYGAAYDDSEYANHETSKQLIVYGEHLQASNGILQHAYDESRQAEWADPQTGRSAEQWCRAMGWYGLAMMDILDILPLHHPNRQHVIRNLQRFAEGVRRYQDPESGRWFQVVNKGDLEDNWTETSCSAMFTNTLSRAMKKGLLDPRYTPAMWRGYAGVLDRVQENADGLADILEICVGTNVGNLSFYLARPRVTNDLHGLGAVLLMNEQVAYGDM